MSYLVQGSDCVSFRNSDAIQDRKGRKSFTPIRLCRDCQKSATNDLATCEEVCRFKGIRRVCTETLEVDFLGGRYTRFVPGADSDYVYTRPFVPKITRHDITLLRSYIAPLLLPVVAQSLALIKSYEEIVCPTTKSPSSQDKCDTCKWTLQFVFWLCSRCGRYSCITCRPSRQKCCRAGELLLSTVTSEDLCDLSMELDIVISSRPPKSRDDATEVSNVEPLIQEALDPESRATPVLREECSYAQFDSFWSLALPIVVRSYANLHGPWSLPGLASVLGEDACEVLDCENPQYAKTTTVDLFLKELANPSHLALGAPVLKLKDYPKRATSERGASILSRDLQSCLPVPKYTSEDGPLNVTTLYSSNYQHTPYFGPVYNAGMISRQDESSHGNTRLRMEIFDTVYIMPTPGKARWLIFPSEYTEKLIDFICDRLQPNLDNPEVTPSLNDYHVYLSPIDLAELRELGIVPFTFDQHERDVVLIPAGCAYQILNMTPCVNVSLNFLAPQSLKRCSEADAHFRASSCSRDALQFGLLLIHSWMSLSVAESQLGDEPPTIAPNKCPDPDFKLAPAKFKTETLLRELATSTAADAEALDPDEDTMEIDAACTSSPTPGSITRSSATPAHPVSATDPEFKVAVKHALYQLGIPIPGLVQRLPQYPSPEHYIPYNYLHPFNFHYPSNMASLGYALPTPTARPLPHQLAMPLPIPMPYSGSIGTGNGPSIHTWDSSIPITPQDPKVEQSSTRSLALDPSGSTSIFRIKTFDRIQRRQRRCYNCARPYPECQGSRKRDECSMKPENASRSK